MTSENGKITERAPVYVAQPLLPELSQLLPVLEDIWASKYVTNHGPYSLKLESALKQYLGVPTAMCFNNGSTALLTALKLFDLPPGSEVITTPLTFAATAHTIAWNGLKPVFADIDPETLTLDPASVEKAITANTSAILPVHVYGTVCDVVALENIANAHNLKLVYDAAHAFGVVVDGKPVGLFGDASVFSFHATKLFTTLEGGLITTPNEEDAQRIYFLRNFGIKSEEEVVDIGINGKMNEVQAAIGLLSLELVKDEKAKRQEIAGIYSNLFSKISGIKDRLDQPRTTSSEQYYPILIDEEVFGCSRDQIYEELKLHNVFARKYFYPLCTDFEPYKGQDIVTTRNTPFAEQAKNQVLCLPYHSGVRSQAIEAIDRVFSSHAP